ncbi:MAG: PAS domain-containing methyl-accepting chemotaxis protein [Actinomycetota bacterium]
MRLRLPSTKPKHGAEVAGDESGDTNEWAVCLTESLRRSQAVIEFTPSGEIVDANENFLNALGYRLGEIRGRHHRMFVAEVEAESEAYQVFWRELRAGNFQSGEFRRVGKAGDDVWIEATYNPILAEDGSVKSVIKLATDVTAQHKTQQEIQDRTQAVIEFLPDGTILAANDLFLAAVGYGSTQVVGQHHRMFMPPGEGSTPEYQQFWPSLARGEFKQGEFRRVRSDGSDLWLQGAYNPVFDHGGNVVRVVKSVSDITPQVTARHEAADVARRTEAGASAATIRVEELVARSDDIGKVLKVIQDLAAQTNLLALNATIESARAGEAGKGFAVVANEVKELASQTTIAASKIEDSIQGIQSEVAGVVETISTITDSGNGPKR